MKGLLLLSGGFDSPVAGWMMKERGLDLSAVHFSSELVTDINSREKAERLAALLGCNLVTIDISLQLLGISKSADRRLYFVMMKRLMYKVSEKIAEREGISFLVTGENIGQVSSQTLQNLNILENSVKIRILRPLLGFDKDWIIKKAREIGAYDISCGPEHCDALGPPHPKTMARKADVLAAEKEVQMGRMVSEAVANYINAATYIKTYE